MPSTLCGISVPSAGMVALCGRRVSGEEKMLLLAKKGSPPDRGSDDKDRAESAVRGSSRGMTGGECLESYSL